REAINDTGFRANSACDGGFTHWHINVQINENGQVALGRINCREDESISSICAKDPENVDLKSLSSLIEGLEKIPQMSLICKNGIRTSESGSFQCVQIATAIGDIPTNPIAFMERLFTVILS